MSDDDPFGPVTEEELDAARVQIRDNAPDAPARICQQRELLADAVRLATEHPEAEIHVLASSERLEEYEWTGHVISKVELGWWYVDGDYIFIDPEELEDHLETGDGAAQALMTRAILIYTGVV